VRWRKSSFK